jgi:hypothetical protein
MLLHLPSSGVLDPFLLVRTTLHQRGHVKSQLRVACQQQWPPQRVRHSEEALASVFLQGVTTRPLKPKSWMHGGRRRLWSGRCGVAGVRLLHKDGEHRFL